MNHPDRNEPTLRPVLGMVGLTLYGIGNMLGAGIYGLVGKAAGEMGNTLWLAFAVSMIAAALTGLSYASLGSRYPRAAGAAFVTQRAFGFPGLSFVVGLAVTVSGLTSMATASNVFADYAHHWTGGFPALFIVSVFILLLALVNFLGLKESARLNALCTLVELAGLLFVIAVGLRYWGGVDYLDARSVKNPAGDWSGSLLLTGAVLTFYSFIGFEDLLNVSEEVKNPRRVFPRALLLALAVTTLVYMGVSVTAVSVVPHETLAGAKTPLVDVVGVAAPWFPPLIFVAVGMFAVTNTALLNFIMGSRLLYGMARQGLLPRELGRLHAARGTPHVAILLLTAMVLGLAWLADVKALATATSLLLLGSFTVVNLSLLRLKLRPGEAPGGFEVPTGVPIAGALISVAFIVNRILEGARTDNLKPIWIAGGLLAGIILLYAMQRGLSEQVPRHLRKRSVPDEGLRNVTFRDDPASPQSNDDWPEEQR